ncbi:MAG: NUDIX domain-containing protein [Chromatiaceae bacterium]|jgi:bis(5'-nucleosidyl)-tetraphosphatase|nr:NUDIX domain-containing protein [Chromatiaceae bacterium]
MEVKKRSAGVILVRPFPDGPRCLLLRAYRYWDFPKGELEPGEAPLAAARREVAEETGLTDLALRWGEDWHETPPYGQGKVARYYLAESLTGDVILPLSPELGRPEHDEARWVRLDEAPALLNERVAAALAWARRRLSAAGYSAVNEHE